MEKEYEVAEPASDSKRIRGRSGVSFPYWDLESAIEVAKTMHDRAGGVCDNAQLAVLLGYSGVSNGSFRTRVSSAKMFGMIEDTDDRKLRVSARGRRAVAPITPEDGLNARVDAFLAVELFKKVFDRFNGTTLPEQSGLRNLLQNEYQVVPDRVAPTVRILLDSAEQAGLFNAARNRSRMVMPLGMPTPAAGVSVVPSTHHEVDRHHSLQGRGDDAVRPRDTGRERHEMGIDPAIVGLLQRLPPGGTPMTPKRRKALIDAFTNVVGFIYPDADDES